MWNMEGQTWRSRPKIIRILKHFIKREKDALLLMNNRLYFQGFKEK